MLDLSELPRFAPVLLAAFVRGFIQAQDPYEKYEEEFGNPYSQVSPDDFSVPLGALIVGTIVSLALQVMFGFWGKSAAEQQGIHPAIGFALGFFFYWIGVKMIPIFRKDRILNKPILAPRPETMNAPNPMYAPLPQADPPSKVAQQQPAPPPQVLVADESGYVHCPACGSRTKAGRKTCMNCGGHLPLVYNPNLK